MCIKVGLFYSNEYVPVVSISDRYSASGQHCFGKYGVINIDELLFGLIWRVISNHIKDGMGK